MARENFVIIKGNLAGRVENRVRLLENLNLFEVGPGPGASYPNPCSFRGPILPPVLATKSEIITSEAGWGCEMLLLLLPFAVGVFRIDS